MKEVVSFSNIFLLTVQLLLIPSFYIFINTADSFDYAKFIYWFFANVSFIFIGYILSSQLFQILGDSIIYLIELYGILWILVLILDHLYALAIFGLSASIIVGVQLKIGKAIDEIK